MPHTLVNVSMPRLDSLVLGSRTNIVSVVESSRASLRWVKLKLRQEPGEEETEKEGKHDQKECKVKHLDQDPDLSLEILDDRVSGRVVDNLLCDAFPHRIATLRGVPCAELRGEARLRTLDKLQFLYVEGVQDSKQVEEWLRWCPLLKHIDAFAWGDEVKTFLEKLGWRPNYRHAWVKGPPEENHWNF